MPAAESLPDIDAGLGAASALFPAAEVMIDSSLTVAVVVSGG